MTWRVRGFRPTDAAAVWEVHVQDLQDSMPFFSPSWATDLHDVERTYLRRGTFLVAEDDGDVVATGGFIPETDDTAWLRRVRVLPAWKGSDVGRELLAELERRARLHGYERVVVHTSEHFDTVNRLVDALGYEQVDRSHRPEWGGDVLYFEKSL
ncbi:GNAT family N-acetyltransferase [Halomarina salina]|uniref:GNAT family N-acetyltransferase n=1 Tax=Halomarina salina TaxID=1872699 RepID=A0ABD5RIF2_9EURY|nr:GNAT family N-acetyltransferase [Halomarina salina]